MYAEVILKPRFHRGQSRRLALLGPKAQRLPVEVPPQKVALSTSKVCKTQAKHRDFSFKKQFVYLCQLTIKTGNVFLNITTLCVKNLARENILERRRSQHRANMKLEDVCCCLFRFLIKERINCGRTQWSTTMKH